MKKKVNASSVILTLLFILSAIVLVVFFGFGYGEQTTVNSNVYTAPHYTGLLIVWLYVLVGICTLSVLVFGIKNGISNMKYRKKGERRTGWGAVVFISLIVVIAASFFMASDSPIAYGDNQICSSVTTLKLVDVCLYSIYALVAITILCALLAMTGVFKSRK